MTTYFVAANGSQTGPFTIEEIRSQCNSQIIQRDTLMWREGLSDWQHAEQVLAGTGVSFAGDEPYGAGSAHGYEVVPDQAPFQFVVPAASLSASRGLGWVVEGWKLFTAAPGMWVVVLLIFLGIQMVLAFIPVLGGLASLLLGPAFAVGLLAYAHGISSTGHADLGALFAGFKDRLGSLVVLALLYFVLMLAVMFIGGVLFFAMIGSAVFAHATGPEQFMSALLSVGFFKFLLFLLLVAGLLALVLSAYLYAPGLVFFAGQSASEAMKESFAACWRNWLPLLVWRRI